MSGGWQLARELLYRPRGDIRNIRKQKQERGSRSYEVEKIYKRRGIRNWLVAAEVVEEEAEL